jgi:hypothetical protein
MDYMIILVLNFSKIAILLSTVAIPFRASAISAQEFQFLCMLTDTCYILFFYSSQPNGYKEIFH